MSIVGVAIAILLAPSAAYWLAGAWGLVQVHRRLPRLGAVRVPERERWPLVSLVIPARDEADTLEASARSRLAQDYPALELVLVDDRSRDGTGALVDRLAAEDARVRAVHVRALPEGWLGKVHALQRGVEVARGEWLLFTDADIHFAPDTVRRAVALCEERGWQFASVLFRLHRTHLTLDAVHSGLMRVVALAGRIHQVEDPRSSAAMGAGVFNLVRRDALARTPGFEHLRLDVADDYGLGQLVKQSGARCGVAHALDHVSLSLYPTLRAFLRGSEKNGYAVMGHYSLVRLALNCAVFALLELAPLLALALPGWPRVAGAAATALALATCALAARVMRRPLLPTLAFPLGDAVYLVAMVRSGWLGWRRGGILWRDTLYPTEMLRSSTHVSTVFSPPRRSAEPVAPPPRSA